MSLIYLGALFLSPFVAGQSILTLLSQKRATTDLKFFIDDYPNLPVSYLQTDELGLVSKISWKFSRSILAYELFPCARYL